MIESLERQNDLPPSIRLFRHSPDRMPLSWGKWDSAAKGLLESKYQITVIEEPKEAGPPGGLLDESFRAIAFPLSVRNLRPVRDWLEEVAARAPLDYPVAAEAKLVFQTLSYIEGKAPEWTANEGALYSHALAETGVAPFGLPSRETVKEGLSAWTLRRVIYVLFIVLPFDGLADFLARLSARNGPIRETTDPVLRFELRPIVIPAGLEMAAQSLTLWDRARTTRSYLQFSEPGRRNPVPSAQDIAAGERDAEAHLTQAERISAEVVEAAGRLFKAAS